jgi:hypothetical protein
MPDIEKLIESTKFALAQVLDEELCLSLSPAKEEISQDINLNFTQSIAWASQVIDIKKRQFKEKMQNALDELKVNLVRSIIEKEASEKSKYEVIVMELKSGELVELHEGDIVIRYRTYNTVPNIPFGCSNSPNYVQIKVEREVVVLRPVVEAQQ